MPPHTPEQLARERIDAQLVASGWVVQNKKDFNPSGALGVAVREYDTDVGPADYILFVDRVPVGVVEAKKPEEAEKFTAKPRGPALRTKSALVVPPRLRAFRWDPSREMRNTAHA